MVRQGVTKSPARVTYLFGDAGHATLVHKEISNSYFSLTKPLSRCYYLRKSKPCPAENANSLFKLLNVAEGSVGYVFRWGSSPGVP